MRHTADSLFNFLRSVSLCTPAATMACVVFAALFLLTGCAKSQGSESKVIEYKLFSGEQKVAIQGYSGDAMEPFLTKDGRFLLFNNRNDPSVNTNLYFAERIDDLHFSYRGEINGVNTAALEGVPSVDTSGNLYFVSTRDYDHSFSTLYRGRFVNGSVVKVELVAGVSIRQPGIVNFDAEISGDGSTLYFVDGDFTGNPKPKTAVMVIALKKGGAFQRDPQSDKILRKINGNGFVYAPAISTDGLELFFTRVAEITATAQPAIYRTTRKSRDEPFGTPEKIAGITGFVEAPTLSADGCRLYYHKKENDRFVIYLIRRKAK